jgi:hypothetical protein
VPDGVGLGVPDGVGLGVPDGVGLGVPVGVGVGVPPPIVPTNRNIWSGAGASPTQVVLTPHVRQLLN